MCFLYNQCLFWGVLTLIPNRHIRDTFIKANEYLLFPDEDMKKHLKPLFIQAKINNVGVNKVLVDGGAAVNLLPQSLLKKIGKTESDLKTHNVVL